MMVSSMYNTQDVKRTEQTVKNSGLAKWVFKNKHWQGRTWPNVMIRPNNFY